MKTFLRVLLVILISPILIPLFIVSVIFGSFDAPRDGHGYKRA